MAPAGTAVSVGAFVVAPRITRFTPAGGAPGSTAILTGANFTGAMAVRINGLDAAFTILSATMIQFIVPANVTTGPITVTTAAGTAASASNFFAPPRIDSFTPDGGVVGTQVVLTGANFTGATVVEFGGIRAVFTVDSDTEITATVPKFFLSGVITVVSPGGTARSTRIFRRQG
jgi:hypothetical protein